MTNQKLRAPVVVDGRFQRELMQETNLEIKKSEHYATFVRMSSTPSLGSLVKATRNGARCLVKVLVLDTSAFIMGLDPLGLDDETYSVPDVAEELRDRSGPSYRLTLSSLSGKMKIQSPTEDCSVR